MKHSAILFLLSTFFVMGFCIGSLPDDSVAWASVKLAFVLAAFFVTMYVARREATLR